jgi:hyperosmotically inducible protein
MKPTHNLTWIAIAAIGIGVVGGCNREYSSDSKRAEQTMDRAEQKMNQAANDVKQQTQKAGDTAKDAAITTKIKTAMIAEPGLKSLQINVDTVNGTVTLSGAVDSQQNLERAQQIAQTVDGVRAVENRLTVKSSG